MSVPRDIPSLKGVILAMIEACHKDIADEREACAAIAKAHLEMAEQSPARKYLDAQVGLTYSVGYSIAAERIEKAIRARGAKCD